MLHSYVVNLDRSTARMTHMDKLVREHHLEYTRVPAIDGTTIARRGDLTAPHTACFLSHIKAWETFLASSYDYALILEDDILMSEGFAETLRDMSWWPGGADVVKVETIEPRGKMIRVMPPQRATVGGRAIYPLLSDHEGAAGYILSREGARKLISLSQGFSRPVDVVMFCDRPPGLGVMQMVPAPIRQLSLHEGEFSAIFKSTIAPDRELRQSSGDAPGLPLRTRATRAFLYRTKYALEHLLARLGRRRGVKIEVPFH